jgi:hypothetical protein
MPVIQQEHGVKSVKGMPERWGVRAYDELAAAQQGHVIGEPMPASYTRLSELLDQITSGPLSLDMTEAQLCIMAEQCASECFNVALDVHDMWCMRVVVESVVKGYGIEPPKVKGDQQAVLRCMDGVWWRRSLRKLHGRAREHAAIRLGFVSSQAGKYCSNEAAHSRVAQNRRNAQGLKNTKMLNVETGQEFDLAQLSDKSTSNNKIRRGELMLRMDGCDEVAQELGHMGLFVTLTAPGAYHAVIEKTGKPNRDYNGATPRDVQTYLRDVWALARAQNARDCIAPYGFRVAEPHHDGCTHWHMVLFMPKEAIPVFVRNLSGYALAEDGNAPGAQEKRVTFKEIDPAQGSAAAYMAKYVGKNIGDNKIEEDKNGRTVISKEMRVDAWAGVWGIRQFQPIGQPPVTGYREFRRVPEKAIEGAPDHVKQAWLACNRVDLIDEETGEVAGVKRCDFAEYIRAQGGVNRGRDYRIAVATEVREVAGRYGMVARKCPTGVYCKSEPAKEYDSIRYTWRRLGSAVDLAVRRPWSPVNNCTGSEGLHLTNFGPCRPTWWNASAEPVAEFDDAWFDSDEYKNFLVPSGEVGQQWHDQEQEAAAVRAATVWTVPDRYENKGVR